MRARRERERERGGKKGYLSSGERLRVGEKGANPMKVPNDGIRRRELRNHTGSSESKLNIGEGRAGGRISKDQKSRENTKVGGYVRRHGGSETRNKQERRYPERARAGDINVVTKRGRPSALEGRRPGSSDTEQHGGRISRRRGR
ncbi:uncharacterized protein EAE97_006725 [Botrytis byssoidea]|uniref:Uncharacterized protein n=1 Tax=Botrytis byssoidea TaxID=139641 RepID=A0A9P5IR96_9HELO|nr:uncharacterized protein EAE97_006725 [Botrytis byssoidea]KAF7941888.1 hypothetical protein EAE97_006725 [Botrytis byssoidea]